MLSAPREIWLWTRTKVSSRYVQKKWLRATVVVIVMMTLMVVPVTSRAIGQADIFAACVFRRNITQHDGLTDLF